MIRTNTSRLKVDELISSALIAVPSFVAIGTVTALWANPFFTRMTPTSGYEFWLLIAESLMLGLYFGLQKPVKKNTCSTFGGILGFLGIACPVCNKLFLYLFGATFLLSYFEPVRLYVGLAGIVLLAWALYQKLLLRFPAVSFTFSL